MQKERTASFYIGEDQWHCTTYALSEIEKIECKSSYLIRRTYEAWTNLRGNNLPKLAGFDAVKLFHEDEGGRISRIDTCETPQKFKLETIGPNAPAVYPLDPDNPFHRHGLLMEILECKETRQPLFQEVRTTIGGKETHKLRLLLPFADENGHVAAIITACCRIPLTARNPVLFAEIIR